MTTDKTFRDKLEKSSSWKLMEQKDRDRIFADPALHSPENQQAFLKMLVTADREISKVDKTEALAIKEIVDKFVQETTALQKKGLREGQKAEEQSAKTKEMAQAEKLLENL